MTTRKSKRSRQPDVVMGLGRTRLEAKGWKIGSTREFLDLTDQEDAYIELLLKHPRLLSIVGGTPIRNYKKRDLTH